MRHFLGPWQWRDGGAGIGWCAPVGTEGLVDLRPLPAQAAMGGAPQGYGFFCHPGPLGSDYEDFGNVLDGTLTAQQAARWRAMLRLGGPLQGATLLDALWETLTDQADPRGEVRPKPLTLCADGSLPLRLKCHGVVRRGVWRPDSPHGQAVKQMLRDEYKAVRALVLEGKAKADLHRMLAWGWQRLYGVDYREFLGECPDEGTRIPATANAESWNGSDSDTFGVDQPWTELVNDWDTVSNCGENITHQATGFARCDADVSSANHYAEAILVVLGSGTDSILGGPSARFSAAANTHYAAFEAQVNNLMYLQKYVAGAPTQLDTDAITPVSGDVCRIQCDGSAITDYQNGTLRNSVTDTTITTGTRGGLIAYQANTVASHATFDDYIIEDLPSVYEVACSFSVTAAKAFAAVADLPSALSLSCTTAKTIASVADFPSTVAPSATAAFSVAAVADMPSTLSLSATAGYSVLGLADFLESLSFGATGAVSVGAQVAMVATLAGTLAGSCAFSSLMDMPSTVALGATAAVAPSALQVMPCTLSKGVTAGAGFVSIADMVCELAKALAVSGTVSSVAVMPSTLAVGATADFTLAVDLIRAMVIRRLKAAGQTPETTRFAQRADTIVKDIYTELASIKTRLTNGGL